MTSQEAINGIGSNVVETKVCEVGTLKEVTHTLGVDGRRGEYMVRITYPTAERRVPLSAVKFTKREPEDVPPVRDGVNHNDFINAMFNLSYSGPGEISGSARANDSRDLAYAKVFLVVFGRLPTAAELNRMVGKDTFPFCETCHVKKEPRFFPEGNYWLRCECNTST